VAEVVKQKESSEVVKDRILKVATELFARHGVDGVGIRKIAAEAGSITRFHTPLRRKVGL
jgi:AcrR family transcriptional regulator